MMSQMALPTIVFVSVASSEPMRMFRQLHMMIPSWSHCFITPLSTRRATAASPYVISIKSIPLMSDKCKYTVRLFVQEKGSMIITLLPRGNISAHTARGFASWSSLLQFLLLLIASSLKNGFSTSNFQVLPSFENASGHRYRFLQIYVTSNVLQQEW